MSRVHRDTIRLMDWAAGSTMTLPPEKQAILDAITARLAAVPGVVAIVLGGSYARGTARPDSDLDVAMYYAEQSPFKIDGIASNLWLAEFSLVHAAGYAGRGDVYAASGVPPGYVQQLSRILAHLGKTAAELTASTRAMQELWASVVALANQSSVSYLPAFKLV